MSKLTLIAIVVLLVFGGWAAVGTVASMKASVVMNAAKTV